MAFQRDPVFRPLGGTAQRVAWAHTGQRRTLANYPYFVDAKSGEIVITERDNHRVQIFGSRGEETRFQPFGCRGTGDNQFMCPSGVTTTRYLGANVIVADTGNRRVSTFRIGTDHLGYGTLQQTDSFGNQIFAAPTGVEFDHLTSRLAVTDPGKSRLTFHDLQNGRCIGETQPVPECPLISPVGVAMDTRGRVYVSDTTQHRVYIYDKTGQFIKVFGEAGYDPGQFNKPMGLCFDRGHNLLVADEANNRIQMFTADGQYIKMVDENIHTPRGISVSVHEELVLATGDAYNFMKILQYK